MVPLPPPTQVPAIAKQPAPMLIPLPLKVEVALLAMLRAPAMVVEAFTKRLPPIVVVPVLDTVRKLVAFTPLAEVDDAIEKSVPFELPNELKIERFAPGVVVPTPMLPLGARKSDDVPTAVFVPEKYANCPSVPVGAADETRHAPFTA